MAASFVRMEIKPDKTGWNLTTINADDLNRGRPVSGKTAAQKSDRDVHFGDGDKSRPARLCIRKSFRVAALITILVFELGFIWFIQHFGWLESVNIWTQAGVVLAALSPLIIAAIFLVGKRFRLSSLLIALSLFAVFMAFTMRPVYEARQSRIATKVLLDADVEFGDRMLTFRFEDSRPVYGEKEAEKPQDSDWVLRLLGNYASVMPSKNVLTLSVRDGHQLDAVASVADQLPNLESLVIDTNIDSMDLSNHSELIKTTPLQSIGFRNMSRFYGSTTGKVDLHWLEGSQNFGYLWFWDYPTAIDQISQLEDCRFEHLQFQLHPKQSVDLDWKEIFSRPVMRKLKFLTMSGYELDDADSACLSQLQNLEYLNLHSSKVSDFSFLQQMPRLVAVSVTASQMDDRGLRDFPVESHWKYLIIRVPKTVSDKGIEDFKTQVREGCEVGIVRM